jgi:hypothetical protein
MTSSSPTSLLDVELRPGSPAVLRAGAPADPAAWAGEHRDALRAAVVEHGSLLVRGLGLRDAAQVADVVGRLTNGLMAEREAFAPRQPQPGGLYSSTPWPANQPMCMHHELSYALEFPGLLLFACLTAPAEGGATAVADAPTVLEALPEDLVARFERDGWLLTRSYNDEIGASVAEAFGTDDSSRRRELLPGQRDRVRVAARRGAAHPAAAQRRRPAPGHRAALLVQPGGVPQRVDPGRGGARIPGGRLQRRRAALQHAVRQRRPDR